MPPTGNILNRIAHAAQILTGRAELAAVTVRVDDSRGWESLNQAPGDRPWSEVYDDVLDANEAWIKSFLIRRIVTLTRAYSAGGGIIISSKLPEVQKFIDLFWDHKKNQLSRKLGKISNHLCIDGELFPILYTNPQTGISYIRFRTARTIKAVLTKAHDYETETGYKEQDGSIEGKTWYSPMHPMAEDINTPIMLHFHINRPLDALRGISDLTPILKWALRYQEWLADRVKLNRQRTRQGIMDITVDDDSQVETVRQTVKNTNPMASGEYVHGHGVEVALHNLNIDANTAEADGHALRLAVAAGSMTALHYLGEGAGTNYATAKEMGEPTARFYTERQHEIIWNLYDLVETAFTRYAQVHNLELPTDLQLHATVQEVARADNESLAQAARDIVQAMAQAQAQGWIDNQTALTLALKFAGETYDSKQIQAILDQATTEMVTEPAAEARTGDTTKDP